MGDFSHASDVYKRNNEVDLASALRGSISFGRFLSETLDWEKWSVFCHNKHLEEAKNCSVPGSVAQKKAYFEAHYRRAASLKPASVLEPENDKPNFDSSGSPTEDERQKPDDSSWMETEIGERRNERHLQSAYSHGLERMESAYNKGGSATGEKVTVPSKESEAFASDNAEKLQEKEPPKEISIKDHQNKEQNKKILIASGLKSNDIREDSGISYSYASRFWKSIAKENKPPQSSMVTSIRSSERRKMASGSLHMSISFKPVQSGQEHQNKVLPIFQKVENSKAGCTLSRASEHRYNHIKKPAKASTSGGLEQTISTPKTEHKRAESPSYEASSGRKKVDAKLCSPSINCFKSPNPKEKREIDAESASSSCKINEKHAESEIRNLRQSYCFKAKPLPDVCASCFKSPNAKEKREIDVGSASSSCKINEKHAKSEIRKLRQSYCFKAKPLPDVCASCFKSPNAKEKREIDAGSASSSCKINEKHAESEIRKLRKSYCFKAKPLPDFYHSTKPPVVGFRKDAESEIRKLGKSCCFKARTLPDFNHNSKPSELEEKKT